MKNISLDLKKNLAPIKDRHDQFKRLFEIFCQVVTERLPSKDMKFTNNDIGTQLDITGFGGTLRCKLLTSIKDGSLIAYIAFFKVLDLDPTKTQYLGRVIFNGEGVIKDHQLPNGDATTIMESGPMLITDYYYEAISIDEVEHLQPAN